MRAKVRKSKKIPHRKVCVAVAESASSAALGGESQQEKHPDSDQK
jgi:hypothetical protein